MTDEESILAKVALIGCGAVVQQYYGPVLQRLEEDGVFRVVAILEPDDSRRQRIQQMFPKADCIGGISELSTASVDFGIVATPPVSHAVNAIQLLSNGISVLCEKPMATSLQECERVIEAVRKSGRLLVVGMVRRFAPFMMDLRECIKAGKCGELESFAISEGSVFDWPVQTDYLFRKETHGGLLLDVGIHIVDAVLWWFGQPSKVRYWDDAMGGVESNCLIELQFESGLSGSIRLSRDTKIPRRCEIILDQESSKSHRDTIQSACPVHGNTGTVGGWIVTDDKVFLGPVVVSPRKLFQAQLMKVAHILRAGERSVYPLAEPHEAVASIKLLEELQRQKELMEMPWLSESERQMSLRLAE